jgi:hypothetical protein
MTNKLPENLCKQDIFNNFQIELNNFREQIEKKEK